MPSKFKILFVTPEAVPFVKTGGVADVSSALPQRLQEMGHDVRIILPKYGAIDERKFKIHEVVRLKDIPVNIAGKEVVFSLRSSFLVGPKARVQIYFLDNPEYFGNRHSLYADPITGEDFPDNDERFILFTKAVFELMLKLGWTPDVIHCNDWQSGLVPVYMKTIYKDEPQFSSTKTLLTIHNIFQQGEFPLSSFEKTDLPDELATEKGLLHNKKINFLKGGILFADKINTVSETYAKELTTAKIYSAGLQKYLKKRSKDLFGIINGIDRLIWDPEKDTKIPQKYSVKKLDNKKVNKKALSENFGFEYEEDVPIIGVISRLTDEKGMDLLQKAFNQLMKLKIKMVLLGAGDKKYTKFFSEMATKYPGKFSCFIGFDEDLAHLIEAGSDMFLMPSKIEPCGLNQLYSLKYGTVPIAHKTGGLADTIIQFDEKTKAGNGFLFEKYTVTELVGAVKKALKLYNENKELWTELMKTGMKGDYSWLNSAKKYVELYKKLSD
ncbi:Glycogen synthase [Melioribacter roseus P3M-2]|uniref:Glycogen synthase n=1 Tax=Melioribacter roseus (strain DSM 23840 / JCM 17771 / VKM B-2668 / P3M-2) TaxID=1191523 RepID=I6YRW8_MELRP|nr:glycogen synthase GlgA [Melioribacter roseus]AFN73297.1 Glycogen synthase [Melioribacter roseus P3M-2]